MTSTQLIGRETMITRLVFFHNERIDKAFPNHSAEWKLEKKSMFSIEAYKQLSTRKICKEYDDTFGSVNYERNYADF